MVKYVLWAGSIAGLVAFVMFVRFATRYASDTDFKQYPTLRKNILSELLLVVSSVAFLVFA